MDYFVNNRIEKLRTHDNSEAVIITKSWLRKLGWKVGSKIKVSLKVDSITVSQNL